MLGLIYWGCYNQEHLQLNKIDTPCFSITLPSTFYLLNREGIDSYVAEIRDSNVCFYVECSCVSYSLDNTAWDYIDKAYSIYLFYHILKKKNKDVSQYDISKRNNPLSIDSVVFFKRYVEGDFVKVYCNIADTIVDTTTLLIPFGLVEQSFVIDTYNGFNRKIVYPNKKHHNELWGVSFFNENNDECYRLTIYTTNDIRGREKEILKYLSNLELKTGSMY